MFVERCKLFFFMWLCIFLDYLFESTGEDLAIVSRLILMSKKKAILFHLGIKMALFQFFFFFLGCFGEEALF